jgi:ribonuclease HIII
MGTSGATFAKWTVREPAQRARVEQALRARGGFVEGQEANCSLRLEFTARGERVIVRQFTSGTLTLQLASGSAGNAPLFDELHELITTVVGSAAAAPAERAPRSGPDPATIFSGSWIGTDEAGKGDYFGPLVSAAVHVFDTTAEQLRLLGVRDSKLMSDQQVRALASQVRSATVHAVVEIRPERYNKLYADFRSEGKSLNTLLAWAHARAIEDLLKLGSPVRNVLVDQFTDVSYIRARLLREARTREINLVATPRAEANVAVAAASILARDRFLQWLANTSFSLKTRIPKGASVEVENAAREIVRRFGPDKLNELAKLHFKTTQRVLGTSGQAIEPRA